MDDTEHALRAQGQSLKLPPGLEQRLAAAEASIAHLRQRLAPLEQLVPAGELCPGEDGPPHLVHVRVPAEQRICAACIRRANRQDEQP